MQYIGNMTLDELIEYEDDLSSQINELIKSRGEVREKIHALENTEVYLHEVV